MFSLLGKATPPGGHVVEGLLVTSSAKLFSILIIGFGGEDASSLLHRYLRKIGLALWRPCF